MESHFLVSCLALTLQVLAATPGEESRAAPPSPSAEPSWTPLNGVLVIVNEDIITINDIQAGLRKPHSEGRITTDADLRRAQNDLLKLQIARKLQVQAGQDLGLPQDRLDWYVGYIMDREKEHAGGVTQLSERLIERRTSSLERRELVAEDLYSETWSQIITGEQAGTLGRPTSDRFVRPGLLAFLHRRLLADPEGYTAFGGVSPCVSLQFLVIDPEREGGVEAGRAYAEEVRALALNGEDFAALVERDGKYKGKNANLQIYEPRLARAEPELAEHVARLAAGEITPVVKLTTLLEVPAWAVVRLVEKVVAVPPDFTSTVVQQKLHGYAQEAFDVQRLESARSDLYRSAYVWPPELGGR